MNKTLESLALLNKIYDSYQKKKDLSEAIQKFDFDFREEETALAAQFNKDLLLPDISSFLDDSRNPGDISNIKTEFMEAFDRFEKDYTRAKSKFIEERSKLKEQSKTETQKNKEIYHKQMQEIDDFLKTTPLSAEYFEQIPELSRLINEGSADTIEKAVNILSKRTNNPAY